MSNLQGVLMGLLQSPDGSHEHQVAYVGHPLELFMLTEMMGVKLDDAQRDAMTAGQWDVEKIGPLMFKDDRGSFLTLRPVCSASDQLAQIARDHLGRE